MVRSFRAPIVLGADADLQATLADLDHNPPMVVVKQNLALQHAVQQSLGVGKTLLAVAFQDRNKGSLPLDTLIAIRNVPLNICEQL